MLTPLSVVTGWGRLTEEEAATQGVRDGREAPQSGNMGKSIGGLGTASAKAQTREAA